MSTKVRTMIAGLALVAVVALALWARPGAAGEAKGFKGDVLKIAELIKKGDNAGAEKAAAAVAKKVEDIADIMEFLKPGSKGGISPFAKPTDGIELKLREVARDGLKSAAGKEGEAWQQAGYVSAAIAQIAHARPQGKDSGKQLKKDWMSWSKDMTEQSIALAKAGKAGSAAEVKTAATKLNATCNACHSVFRQ